MAAVQRRKCRRCQGSWFRKRRFAQYRPFWPDTRFRLGYEQDSAREYPALICLCGMPDLHALYGQRPPTEELLTRNLLDSISDVDRLAPMRAFERLQSAGRERAASL